MSRAEPYRREVRSGSGSAGSVRAPVSTTSSPSGASTFGRCSASFGSSSAHASYGGSTRTRSYVRDSRRSSQTRVAAGDPRAGEAEPLEVLRDRPAGRPVALDEGDARGAARERLDPHRAGAGEEVEHAGVVDRPDQVERGLADAVAGRPGREPLRRGDPRPAVRAGDDSHAPGLRTSSPAPAAASASRRSYTSIRRAPNADRAREMDRVERPDVRGAVGHGVLERVPCRGRRAGAGREALERSVHP